MLKRYLLASHHNPEWTEKEVKTLITKSPAHAVLREVSETAGKESITNFLKLQSSQGKTFFMATPLTGRTHQIRLHASHIGIPLLGDNFYGGSPAEELHLLSYEVGFWHPIRNEEILISVPYPLLPRWAREAVY